MSGNKPLSKLTTNYAQLEQALYKASKEARFQAKHMAWAYHLKFKT
jgi:hypothetical protein